MSIIIFIIILAVLILIHEFGHFIAAKKQGVRVDEFGFGLPPRLFGIKIGETLYSLNLIPLGGFVKLYGEEYHEIKKKTQSAKAFINKKPWQKALIILAGVMGNFLLGWFLISFLFTQGVPVPTDRVIVEKVTENSPAEIAGFKTKDVITNIELKGKQYPIKESNDLIELSRKFGGEELIMTVSRENKSTKLKVTPRKNPPKNEGPLGVTVTSFIEKKFPWYQAPVYGLIESVKITSNIFRELSKILFQLVTFQKPDAQISGPIGIAQFTATAIKFGNNAVLELMALLSFNLAIINILPFPALDGGRLVFVIYEWITGRQSNKNLEKYVNFIGFVILLSLGVLISVFDVIKLYK
jgi:regulator of sigma E protease